MKPNKIVVPPPRQERVAKVSASERFRNVALGVAGVISSILIPLLGLYYTSRDKEREVSRGFVEIATKILSDKPTSENRPLREWAIALIDNYSAVRLPADARDALLTDQPIFEGPTQFGNVSRNRLQELQRNGFTLGVLVSHFTPAVDFQALKEHGVQFVFVKASQGATRIDDKAVEYAASAKQNGLKVGLYHFFMPTVDVDAQLSNFITRLTSIQWNLPPLIDCEEIGGGISPIPPDYASRVEQFAAKLEKLFHLKPMIYTSSSFALRHLDQGISGYPLFIAQIGGSRTRPSIPKWWTDYQFWHVGVGVNDDPVLRPYDIAMFKGRAADLDALVAQR